MRRATENDADAISAIAIAGGEPSWTPQTVRERLATAGRGALVASEDGRVVAFALLNGIDAKVMVDPAARGHGLGTRLREEIERGAGGPVVRQEVDSSNAAARELLHRAGYATEQRYRLMERRLTPDEPAPTWPPGADPRRLECPRDDPPVYDLIATAMREIPGNTERTFEEWTRRALTDSLAPELSTVVGAVDGVVLSHRFPDAEGHIDYVAVSATARGHGLGRALLQESFRLFAADGLRTAALWVNGENEGATRLYRAVGMEVTATAERLVKPL